MRSTVAERETVRDIEVMGGLDLDSRELRRRVAARLRRHIPADAFCFGSIDPSTLLVIDDVSEGLPPGAASAAVHNEYLVDDVLKFAALARSPESAGILSVATGGDPRLSHRFRAVLPAIGARHELRSAFVVDGQCWGAIAMFRAGGQLDFPHTAAALLRRLSAPIGAALRRAVHRCTTPGEGPVEAGVLTLDGGWRLISANPAAAAWLDELAVSRGTGLPIAVLEVAARGHSSALPAYGRVRGRSGRWLTLQASPLVGDRDPALTVVTVHPAPASAVTEVLVLAYGLTRREREVVEHAVAGLPSRAIAGALGITTVTVQDHLKAAFAKAGVRSRGELVARLIGTALPG